MSLVHISKERPILLGSASPRRRELLAQLGLPVLVRPGDVAEEKSPGDTPESFLHRVTRDKLQAALGHPEVVDCACVLVADTVVILDGEILGKPADELQAFDHLSRLAGRTHRVCTRYALSGPGAEAPLEKTVSTLVRFRSASAASLRGYAESGEGLDKAGAYALQGLGSFLVCSIEGSPSNVIGLPQSELVSDLLAAGWLKGFPSVF